MKNALFVSAALIAALSAPSAFASQELAQKKNCMACHAVDKKLVGPAYKDVAAKYAKDKDAVKTLRSLGTLVTLCSSLHGSFTHDACGSCRRIGSEGPRYAVGRQGGSRSGGLRRGAPSTRGAASR